MIDIFEKLAPQWQRAVKDYARAVWNDEDDDEAREIYDNRARLFARRYRHALESYYAAKGMRVYRGTLDGKVKEWLNNQSALRNSLKTMVADRQSEIVRKEIARLQKDESYTAQEALDKVYAAHKGEHVYKVFSFNEYYKDKSEQIGDENAYNLGTAINEGIIQEFSDRYIWTTQRDRRVRKTHRKLQGKCFLFSDPPTTVTKGGKEHKGNPGTDWGCVPSGTLIRLNADVIRCFRRAYTGELSAIVTESGIMLRATGNHPILTKSGWKSADSVTVGDYLVKVPDKSFDGIDGDKYNTGIPIEKIFDFFSLCGVKESVPGSRSQFHGDGIPEKEVEIVTVKRELTNERNAVTGEQVGKLVFSDADVMPGHLLGTSESELSAALFRLGMTARRFVSGLCDFHSIFGRGILKADDVGLTAVSRGNSSFLYSTLYKWAHTTASKIFKRTRKNAQAVHIVADDLVFERVVSVMRVPYSGHVYNLQTATDWYIANGLSIHNCRCYASIPTRPMKPERNVIVHEGGRKK